MQNEANKQMAAIKQAGTFVGEGDEEDGDEEEADEGEGELYDTNNEPYRNRLGDGDSIRVIS